MVQSAVYIPSLDAKDIYLTNHYIEDHKSHHVGDNPRGYTLLMKDGSYNIKRFINTLDYSLDLIKLREVYEKVYRRINFDFKIGDKDYTNRVINVTFKYSVKEFNRIGANFYVRRGYDYTLFRDKMKDGTYIKNGELIAIQVNQPIEHPINDELLNGYFKFVDGQYVAKKNMDSVLTVADLRMDLYEHGFWCDGIHFVRFKRSAGSSRVGKCLFIDERLYKNMHKWECCGLKIKEGQETDLAGFESYISLTLSSIIDTLEINPENILLIDDYDSEFEDRVVVTRIGEDGHLKSGPETIKIKNCIWDGQSLIDYSLLGEYDKYGMVLLRNRFFKSCCFNTNIQAFFQAYGITDISQLNGKTTATRIEDIKLITTPSSIKYTKFGTFQQWLDNLDPLFGIVKHDKKTHFFNGELVSTHYQLINTLQLSEKEISDFMRPSIEYLERLDTDPATMRLQVKAPVDEEYVLPTTSVESKNDIVYKMLGLNEEFAETKIYAEFKHEVIKAYKNNLRCGHVLINGNYSTLLGNPMEMLLSAIGKFDGKSFIGEGNVHSIRFEFDKDLILCRSPHCTMGNLCIQHNVACDPIDIYFNLTNEIICLNSINENILNRLSGCD